MEQQSLNFIDAKVVTGSQSFMVFSAERPGDSAATVAKKIKDVEQSLNLSRMSFLRGQGSYKGRTETCWYVCINNDEYDVQKVLGIASMYDQESVLVVRGQDGAAALAYLDDDDKGLERIGKWVSTSEEDAKQQDSYTCLAGTYWVVE